MVALNSLQRKAWEISENPQTEEKTRVQALSLVKDCVINKMDLLTNATVVNDAIKFVIDSKQKLKLGNQKGIYNENNESKEEPDSDEKDSDRLQERNRNGKEQKKVKLRTRFFD
jgi:hypothetical protein